MLQTTLGQRSLGSEIRAILAVAKKEWTIFRRYPSWVVAVLVWPLLLPFVFILTARALAGPDGAALPAFYSLTGTNDYTAYIVIGSLLWGWLNMTLWDVGFTMRNEQMRGTLESNWLCPVWRISILLGGSLTKAALAVLFLVLSVLEFQFLFGVQLITSGLPLFALVILLLIPCIYGIGIAFGSLVVRFKEANAMVFLVRGVFMIFCGMTYPLAVMPGWMQAVAAGLPLTYAIAGVRQVVLNGATLPELWPALWPLAMFAVILPLVGWLAFNATARRARRVGDLGVY